MRRGHERTNDASGQQDHRSTSSGHQAQVRGDQEEDPEKQQSKGCIKKCRCRAAREKVADHADIAQPVCVALVVWQR